MKDDATQEPAEQEKPEKHAGGRPLKFESPDELQVAINAYFSMCDPHLEDRLVESGIDQQGHTIFSKRQVMTEQEPYTVSGLARAIGLTREGLIGYSKRDEYSDTVAAARERCHEYAEKQLYGRAQSGAAFSLKNNWGWKDRQELTGAEGAPLMPIGLDSAILARMKDRGETSPVATEDSGE